MKKLHVLVSAACVLCSAVSAFAKPVGSMTCNNLPSFNVSAYTFGLPSNGTPACDTKLCAGGGLKPSPSTSTLPLEVHTSLTQFGTFLKLDGAPKALQCTLMVSGNDGSSVSFEFSKVLIQSVTVSASSGTKKDEEKAAFTDVVLSYGTVSVSSSSGGDDGGSTPSDPGDWNHVHNNPVPLPSGPLGL